MLDWQDFKGRMRQYFIPQNEQMKLMDDWKMIKQGEGSLLDYADKYQQHILQFPHLHELTRLHGFFSCLRYRIRIDVEKQNPRNLAEAMRLAERIGDLEFVNRSFRSWGFTSQYSPGRGRLRTTW